MKTLNGKEILAVVVPNNAKNFTVIESHSYFHSPRVEHSIGGVNLPEGNWTILGRPSEISEEVARMLLISGNRNGKSVYLNYNKPRKTFNTAIQSFKGWCKTNGITDKHILLIKNP